MNTGELFGKEVLDMNANSVGKVSDIGIFQLSWIIPIDLKRHALQLAFGYFIFVNV